MDFNTGFVTSLILLPRFLFEAFWSPILVIERAMARERTWDRYYPTSEFLSVIIVAILTMAIYSYIENGLIGPTELTIPEFFDRQSSFAKAAFFAIALPLTASVPIFLVYWIAIKRRLERNVAERIGRVIVIILLFLSFHYIVSAVIDAISAGTAKKFELSGNHQPLSPSPGTIRFLEVVRDIFLVIAVGYFFAGGYFLRCRT